MGTPFQRLFFAGSRANVWENTLFLKPIIFSDKRSEKGSFKGDDPNTLAQWWWCSSEAFRAFMIDSNVAVSSVYVKFYETDADFQWLYIQVYIIL